MKTFIHVIHYIRCHYTAYNKQSTSKVCQNIHSFRFIVLIFFSSIFGSFFLNSLNSIKNKTPRCKRIRNGLWSMKYHNIISSAENCKKNIESQKRLRRIWYIKYMKIIICSLFFLFIHLNCIHWNGQKISYSFWMQLENRNNWIFFPSLCRSNKSIQRRKYMLLTSTIKIEYLINFIDDW